MSDMPKYNPNLSGSNIKTDEELEKATVQKPRFKPGKCGVKIKEVKFKSLSKSDATWFSFEFVLEGPGGATMRTWVDAPTTKPEYGEKGKLFMFKKTQAFAAALGEDLKISNFKPVLTKIFKDPTKLVGKSLEVNLGYEQAHARFVSRAGDAVTLALQLPDGNLYQENGVTKEWSGVVGDVYKAIGAFCADKKIGYDSNLKVLQYFPAEVPSSDEAPAWLES